MQSRGVRSGRVAVLGWVLDRKPGKRFPVIMRAWSSSHDRPGVRGGNGRGIDAIYRSIDAAFCFFAEIT
uniref:Uncharacterized protein n=1 Tax=Ectopseudomonas oleovorans TaxID=301 RepID=A0A653B301_ECTOL